MEELKQKLTEILSNQDSIMRRIGVVAILTQAFKKYFIIPVIVGGFAVELIDWTYCERKAEEKQIIEMLQEIKTEAQNLNKG